MIAVVFKGTSVVITSPELIAAEVIVGGSSSGAWLTVVGSSSVVADAIVSRAAFSGGATPTFEF